MIQMAFYDSSHTYHKEVTNVSPAYFCHPTVGNFDVSPNYHLTIITCMIALKGITQNYMPLSACLLYCDFQTAYHVEVGLGVGSSPKMGDM